MRLTYLLPAALALACAHGAGGPAAPESRTHSAIPVTSGSSVHEATPAQAAPHESMSRYDALAAAPDRTAEDRALDPGRKPAAFLAFLQVQPGMHVAELMAGGGYTTELLARAVAPNGVVYAENPKWVLEQFAEKPLTARLARPANKDVVRVDRPLDDPFPPQAHDLDLVVSNAIYHDSVWLGVDRARMNQAVFAALKSGGHYAICDSSAVSGHGLSDVKTLHRIDEASVKSEVTAAGFRLESQSDILRNPQDTRDWSASPGAAGARRGTSDRFCLRFVKP